MSVLGNHYLESELYEGIRSNPVVFNFLNQSALDGLWYWDLESPENFWMSSRLWEVLGYDPSSKAHW